MKLMLNITAQLFCCKSITSVTFVTKQWAIATGSLWHWSISWSSSLWTGNKHAAIRQTRDQLINTMWQEVKMAHCCWTKKKNLLQACSQVKHYNETGRSPYFTSVNIINTNKKTTLLLFPSFREISQQDFTPNRQKKKTFFLLFYLACFF